MFLGTLAPENPEGIDFLELHSRFMGEVEVHHFPQYLFFALPNHRSAAMEVRDCVFFGERYSPVSVLYLNHAHYTSQVCVPPGAWYTHDSMGGVASGSLRLNDNGFFDTSHLPTCKRLVLFEKKWIKLDSKTRILTLIYFHINTSHTAVWGAPYSCMGASYSCMGPHIMVDVSFAFGPNTPVFKDKTTHNKKPNHKLQ